MFKSITNEQITLHQFTKNWGNCAWKFIHLGSMVYPTNPSQEDKDGMRTFIYGLPYILPCPKCKEHAKEYIQNNLNLIEDAIVSKKNLFQFFVNFHNSVNLLLGRLEKDTSEMWIKYKKMLP